MVDLRTQRTQPSQNTTYDMFKDEWLTQTEEENPNTKNLWISADILKIKEFVQYRRYKNAFKINQIRNYRN